MNAVIWHEAKKLAPPVAVRLKLAFKSASTPLILTADCVVVKVPADIITPLAIAPVIACSVNDAERLADAVFRNEPAMQLIKNAKVEFPGVGYVQGKPFRAKADVLTKDAVSG